MRVRVLFLALCLAAGCSRPKPDLTVYAAASTAEVLAEIADAYETQSGKRIRLNFGSSGVLARQIAAGAPADVFLSASLDWVDYLLENGLADPASRCVPMRNRLVLVAPAEAGPGDATDLDPAATLETSAGRIAMGDPGHVPAGTYARETLQALGLYDRLAGRQRLLLAQDVRAALALVELGECELGIVYATDARRSPAVRTIFTFPEKAHRPIDYAMVATADASEEAGRFITFACGTDAADIIANHGFETPSSPGP